MKLPGLLAELHKDGALRFAVRKNFLYPVELVERETGEYVAVVLDATFRAEIAKRDLADVRAARAQNNLTVILCGLALGHALGAVIQALW